MWTASSIIILPRLSRFTFHFSGMSQSIWNERALQRRRWRQSENWKQWKPVRNKNRRTPTLKNHCLGLDTAIISDIIPIYNDSISISSFGASPGLINSSAASAAIDNFERQFLRVLSKVYQTIERNEIRLAEQDRKDAIKLEWQQVALVIDRYSSTLHHIELLLFLP